MVFASVRYGDWTVEAGQDQIRKVASSSFGYRLFCGSCGTPLLVHVEHQPDTIDFSVTTLDDPSRLPPEFHIFWSSAPDWLQINDGLRRHDRFRPNTRGLEGTEPPAE
jgi:hypothetical protein